MYNPFNMLFDSVCQHFVERFASVFIRNIGLPFSLFGFPIMVMLVSQNALENVPSSSVFMMSLRRADVNFSLNVWQNSPVEPPDPGCFPVGRFLIFDSISLFFFTEFFQIFYFFLSQLLVIYLFLGICHFIYVI